LVRVRVSYVALVADATGKREEVIEVSSKCTLGELLEVIMSKYPKLRELSREVTITALVNGVSNDLRTLLKDGDEVALLPPASGG